MPPSSRKSDLDVVGRLLEKGILGAAGFERLSVLIVDPNRHMRTLVRGVLHAFLIRNIREAPDGATAFKEWRTFPADIIITEMKMEPLDGIEFTQMVRRASDSPNRYVPVIMLTAYTERHNVEKARDAGITEFLSKPISAEALYARIHAVVHRQRPFIETRPYVGPDRRRRGGQFVGSERRKNHGDPNLTQEEVKALLEG